MLDSEYVELYVPVLFCAFQQLLENRRASQEECGHTCPDWVWECFIEYLQILIKSNRKFNTDPMALVDNLLINGDFGTFEESGDMLDDESDVDFYERMEEDNDYLYCSLQERMFIRNFYILFED